MSVLLTGGILKLKVFIKWLFFLFQDVHLSSSTHEHISKICKIFGKRQTFFFGSTSLWFPTLIQLLIFISFLLFSLTSSHFAFFIPCRRVDIDFLEEQFHFIQNIFIILYFKVDSQSHDLYSLLEATMNDHFVISLMGYISSWFDCINFWQQLPFS